MKKTIEMKKRFFYLLFLSVLLLISCNKKGYDPYSFDWDISDYFSDRQAEYIAVFGDIQFYTNHQYVDLFKRSLNWIEYAKEKMGILCVLHTGDIVQTNSALDEWGCFAKAMTNFSVPFISNIGNHDYQWSAHSLINDRMNTHFNEYVQFPLVTSRIEAAFEAGRYENIVVRNEINGQRYDILALEFGPRKEVVEWANEWVKSHADIKYILMTHEYLEKGGGRRTSGIYSAAQFRNTTYTTPEGLWNQLIKCNDNIVCVLCGHVGGLYAVTYDDNDFGRSVCQIQHNIQGSAYRYDNWLMMWEFPEDSDDANVFILNTATGKLFDSTDALFTFKYRY